MHRERPANLKVRGPLAFGGTGPPAGEHGVSIVYQPIFRIAKHELAGHEALARFADDPARRPPDQCFSEAATHGLQEHFELAAIRQALTGLAHFPSETYVSFNISPQTLVDGPIEAVLDGWPLDRLMLEITEHALVHDYPRVAAKLEPLRRKGLRLAVDDAGAGFASFRHILELKPDVIKLDISLIRHIHLDAGRRALAAALIRFARATGSAILAEGVESDAELDVLRQLRVNTAQGYLLGRPMPIGGAGG